MWRQWINFILGMFIAAMAYSGFSAAWVVGIAILIALIALWAALEGASEGHTAAIKHAH